MNSGGTLCIPYTPVVFWAVREVMTLQAYMPCTVMVLISAWIPAPPLGSEPAMVSIFFMGLFLIS